MATHSQAMIDALLTAMATRFNNGGGTAEVEIYSAADVLLAQFALAATPFGAVGAGAAGYRQIAAASVPIAGVGETGAGAGTNASYALVKAESGATDSKLTVSGAGGGGDVVLSNINIADGQDVNLLSLAFRMAYDSSL